MVKRVVVGVLCSALLVVVSGCGDECTSPADCTSDKGAPAEGKVWACENKKCVQQDETEPEPEPEPGDDGGTDGGTDPDPEPDGGTVGGPDGGGGTDGGMTDGGTDAGTAVGKNGACTSSAGCLEGLRCEGEPGARTCQSLHIAMTAGFADGGTQAVAVRHDETAAAPFSLSEFAGSSRYPRWNADGTSVALVEDPGTAAPDLVSRRIPLVAGETLVLSRGEGATEDFLYMEWAPSESVVWVRKNGTSSSGLSWIAGGSGAAATLTQSGVFPSWAPNGTSLAYSTNAEGLLTLATTGSATPVVVPGGASGEQPLHNRANDWLLFLKANGSDPDIGPLYELFTLPAGGGTANPIATKATDQVGGGVIESFIANHTWSPDGTWAAYVRAYFSNPNAPNQPSAICGTQAATLCPTRDGNVIFLRKVNPTTGVGEGTELQLVSGGTLPSFSPDGQFIAYVKGRRLYVQRINPADGSTVGAATVHSQGADIQTSRGDDHRPRWQPR